MTMESDWLPAEVAAANPDGVTVWYLGCNGFVLKAVDGTTLFINQYLGTGAPLELLEIADSVSL